MLKVSFALQLWGENQPIRNDIISVSRKKRRKRRK